MKDESGPSEVEECSGRESAATELEGKLDQTMTVRTMADCPGILDLASANQICSVDRNAHGRHSW